MRKKRQYGWIETENYYNQPLQQPRRFRPLLVVGIILGVLLGLFILFRPNHVESSKIVQNYKIKTVGVNIPLETENVLERKIEGSMMTITAYSELDSCHYENCAMASGKPAYVGAVACPRHIPLGTKLEIAGLGEFTCEDRYSKRLEERIDIFMGYGQESYDWAVSFGKQQREVVWQ